MAAVRILLVLILGFIAAGSALIFSAARSDFVFRGCPDLNRSEWGATVNCSDGWLAQVVFGTTAAVSLGLAIWIGIRRRQA